MASASNEKQNVSLSQEVAQLLESGTFLQAKTMLNGLAAADTAHLIESSPPPTRSVLWSLIRTENRSELGAVHAAGELCLQVFVQVGQHIAAIFCANE